MKTLILPFTIATILSVGAILATCGCSSQSLQGSATGTDGAGDETSGVSVGFEFGTRTVAGPVIDIFGYSVGFGVFLPSKTIEQLQTKEGSK